MANDKLINEILQAKRFLFAMTDKVRYILITNEETDKTLAVENGRYDIFITSMRHIDGVYIPVLPAVLHEYGHILFSRLKEGEAYLKKYAPPEEIVVNSLLIEKRFPAAYKDLSDIYVSDGLDWFMAQLKNTSRHGIKIDFSGVQSDERDRLPELFEQAKKLPALNDRAGIYDEILRIVGQKQEDFSPCPSTFKGLIAAMLDTSNSWCSLSSDKPNQVHDVPEQINSILRDMQDAIEKELSQTGFSNPATDFVGYNDIKFVEPDPNLARQIRIMLHARAGENKQFVHNLPAGRISLKYPHKLQLAMRGASTTYHKARKDGDIDVCIGVLVDASGSMMELINEASVAAASIYAALNDRCKVIIGTFGEHMYYSSKGMPGVYAKGGTPGYSATISFQNLIASQKESKKYILVLSDFEYSDAPMSISGNVPVFGLGYGSAKAPRDVRYCGEATAENIVKFFLQKVK